jgi:hypothetical protein
MRSPSPTADQDPGPQPMRGEPSSGHAFAVGQTVRFLPSLLQPAGSGGLYVIVRQLPEEAEGPQYQVCSVEDGQQRVAPEIQLRVP